MCSVLLQGIEDLNSVSISLFFFTSRALFLTGLWSRMAIKAIELLKGSGNHEEIFEVLAAVAASLGDVIDDVNTLQVTPLKGAMTNEVFEVNWPTKSDGHQRRVLVRLYGEGVEVFFNRVDEIQTFECMSKHGQGPRLLGRFTTGRVEEFIHAKVCDQLLVFPCSD